MLAWASSVATGRSSRDLELRISNNPHIVLLARLFNRHLLILAAGGDNGRLLIPTLARVLFWEFFHELVVFLFAHPLYPITNRGTK